MAGVSHTPDLDSTLGAAFLGNIFTGILYGGVCLQTFIYFRKCQADRIYFRVVIGILWALDSFHLALVTHALYFYLIKSFSNPLALVSPNWSIMGQVYVTCTSNIIMRAIYGRRVWMLSHSVVVVVLIAFTTLLTFCSGFAFAILGWSGGTFEKLNNISFLMYTSLGSAVAADILIATSICVCFTFLNNYASRTDSMVTVLILYSINSCGVTSICSLACFITYAVWPMEFTFIGIYFCLSKLFLNSLLAMLNGRTSLKNKVTVVTGDGSFNLSSQSGSSKPTDFPPFASTDVYAMDKVQRHPMAIAVNRHVETIPAV